MLNELSIKKLLAIAASIAWIDFIASQKCIHFQCCPDNCKVLLLYGIAPVVAIWTIYCVLYSSRNEKKATEKAAEHIVLDSEKRE